MAERPTKAKMRVAIKQLLSLKIQGGFPQCPKGHPVNVYEISKKELEEDGGCTFFSEAYLYNLLGKEDARSVRGLLYYICEACGLSMHEIEDEVYREQEKQAQEIERRAAFKRTRSSSVDCDR